MVHRSKTQDSCHYLMAQVVFTFLPNEPLLKSPYIHQRRYILQKHRRVIVPKRQQGYLLFSAEKTIRIRQKHYFIFFSDFSCKPLQDLGIQRVVWSFRILSKTHSRAIVHVYKDSQ